LPTTSPSGTESTHLSLPMTQSLPLVSMTLPRLPISLACSVSQPAPLLSQPTSSYRKSQVRQFIVSHEHFECTRVHSAARNPRFKHIVTFNMDEYVGIPHDHSESYHTFMFRELFSHSPSDLSPDGTCANYRNAVDILPK